MTRHPERIIRPPFALATAVAVLIVGVIGALAQARPAAAGSDGNGAVDIDTISAQVRYDSPPREASDCWWAPMRGVDPVTAADGVVGTRLEQLYYKVCDGGIVEYRWITLRTTDTVRTSAAKKVSKVVNMLLTRTAPPADRVVANSAMWFWVPRSVWKPVRVTAWVATPIGPVSVTTVATPDRLRFTPGDGTATIDCDGPGRAWSARVADPSDTACRHVYSSASHGADERSLRARFAVKWSVKWTSNLGIGGPLPSITTGVGMPIRVHEVQALAR